jgi:quercetin dioxygenase-like cupin family protein/DNA-binding XRE family transcriptional regulator
MTQVARAPRARKRAGVPTDEAVRSIGERLRLLRQAQKRTLTELADLSGVDTATISRIETGRMSGTLESHIRLASALGLKLTDLYAGIEEVRARRGATVQLPAQQKDVYVHEAGKSSIALLTSDIMQKKLMPVLVTIEPGGRTQREEARVGTEKFLYVLDGAVEARVGEDTHQLKRGSSLYLDAAIPHSFRNAGRSAARMIAVVTPPAL